MVAQVHTQALHSIDPLSLYPDSAPKFHCVFVCNDSKVSCLLAFFQEGCGTWGGGSCWILSPLFLLALGLLVLFLLLGFALAKPLMQVQGGRLWVNRLTEAMKGD